MKNAKKRKPQRKKQKKELFVLRDDRRYRISFHTLFTVLLIFAGGLGTAFSYAYIGAMQTRIAEARTALQTQKDENAALRAEIIQKYTLDEVARIATERLDMKKPDSSQIIHINVPMQSYVELYDEDIAAEPDSLWEKISNFFSQALGTGA